MAWVKLHDGAMKSLKILMLPDSAFRLWIKGLCFCQEALTDGVIPRAALKELGVAEADVETLSTPQVPGRAPLWEPCEAGFLVHDYLDWNDPRTTVVARQIRARQRKAAYLEKQNAFQNAFQNALGTGTQTKPNQTKQRWKYTPLSRRCPHEPECSKTWVCGRLSQVEAAVVAREITEEAGARLVAMLRADMEEP